MIKLSIIGQDTLAAAIFQCCSRHFDVTQMPDHSSTIWWICYDTPIGSDDRPDGEWVIDRIRELLVDVEHPRPIILVSSQMPVGTTAALEQEFPGFVFAHSPENIRVATAVADFENQARIVLGVRDQTSVAIFEMLFAPFTKQLIVTDPETAELSKMTLNAWLALQVVFINEIARICRREGGDPDKVSLALRTDARCNLRAPLRPGAPYGLGHLAREVHNANLLVKKHGLDSPILANIKRSNEILVA